MTMMHRIDFYIDHDQETGQPFIGLETASYGVTVRVQLADKKTVKALLVTIAKAAETLERTPPKLITTAEGVPNGFRKT